MYQFVTKYIYDRLRGIIGSTLSNTSQDLREQADRVQQTLTDRVAETEEATRYNTFHLENL